MHSRPRSRGCSRNSSAMKAAAALVLAAVVLAGCAQAYPGGEASSAARRGAGDSASDSTLMVRGVESCQVLADMARSNSTVGTGETLESIPLPCLQPGSAVDLSQMRGKVVVVNLWATWCGPCREEMPILQAASEQFRDRVQFVGVVTKDSASSAAGFLPAVGTTYPQLLDVDAELLNSLRIPGLPVTVILDPAGTIVKKQIGAFEADDLDSLLADLVEAS